MTNPTDENPGPYIYDGTFTGFTFKQSILSDAADHALLLSAIMAGKANTSTALQNGRCESVQIKSLEDGKGAGVWFVDIDPFGCPILTPELRAGLQEAMK